MDSTSINYLDPDKLNYYFKYKNVFGFVNELNDSSSFTYGYFVPKLLKNDQASLHVTVSTKGGKVLYVNQVEKVGEGEIKEYIKNTFGFSLSEIKLIFIEQKQSHFLQFTKEVDPEQNVIPISYPDQTPITHKEGMALTESFEGREDEVSFVTLNSILVPCKVESVLVLDTPLLISAFEAEVKSECDCENFLSEQIAEQEVRIELNAKNAPSEATIEEVKATLITNAALVMWSKLKGINKKSQIPDEYFFEIQYNNEISQYFKIENRIDLTDAYQGIPVERLVSKSDQALPEPSRDGEDPIPPAPEPGDKVTVNLDFAASNLEILKIIIQWGGQEEKMKWPNFPPLVIERDKENQAESLKITTVYADYKEATSVFDVKEKITLQLKDIGYATVLFDASGIQEYFKKVTGKADYYPENQALKKSSTSFDFEDENWNKSWMIRTLAPRLNGMIKYSWTGEYENWLKKDYQSGDLETSNLEILLKKK